MELVGRLMNGWIIVSEGVGHVAVINRIVGKGLEPEWAVTH